jgi:hypothetical protein
MQKKQRRRELHEEAAKEQDFTKLAALLEEIERLLQENKARLRKPIDPTKEGVRPVLTEPAGWTMAFHPRTCGTSSRPPRHFEIPKMPSGKTKFQLGCSGTDKDHRLSDEVYVLGAKTRIQPRRCLRVPRMVRPPLRVGC